MREMSAGEIPMLLPAELDSERVIDALCWLGISRDVVSAMSAVTIQPRSISFDVWALGEKQPVSVTVEAMIVP